MVDIVIYTMMFCPYCTRAKSLLKKKGASFKEIKVSSRADWAKVEEVSGRNTVPQIFIGKTHVGGFDDLARLESQGKLDPLLKS